jgi:WD40 repeat protein
MHFSRFITLIILITNWPLFGNAWIHDQQTAALHPADKSHTCIALFISSSKSAHASTMTKKLVAELQREPRFEVAQLDAKNAEGARRSAADRHCAYLVVGDVEGGESSGIGSKMKGLGRGIHVPLTSSKPEIDRKPLKVSFSLERPGNPKELYGREVSDDAPKDEDALQFLAKSISADVVREVLADLTPVAQAIKTEPAVAAVAKPVPSADRPRLVVQTAHSSQVSDFVYSQDGEILVTLGIDGVFKIWAAKEGAELRTFAGYRVAGIAISPDGKMLATVDRKGTVRIVDLIAGAIVKTIPGEHEQEIDADPLGLTYEPVPVSYSPDGRIIVHGGPDGVRVLDAVTAERLRAIGHQKMNVLAISPSSDLIATVIEEDKVTNKIQVFRTATGGLASQFSAGVSEVTALVFGPEGLAAGSRNGSVLVFDPNSGKRTQTIILNTCDKLYGIGDVIDKIKKGPFGIPVPIPGSIRIPNMGGNNSGQGSTAGTLNAGCENYSAIKSLRSGIYALAPFAGIRSMDVSSDGKLLAYSLANGTIKIRNLTTPSDKAEVEIATATETPKPASAETTEKEDAATKDEKHSLVPFFWMRSSIKLSSLGPNYYVNSIRSFKTVSRWDARTGAPVSSLAVAKRDLNPYPIPMPLGSVPEFSTDGSQLITASLTNGVKAWDLRSGVAEQVSDAAVMFSLPISADGKLVARTKLENGATGKVHVVINEVGSEHTIVELPHRYSGFVLPRFGPPSPKSSFIAILGMADESSPSVRVYELPSGHEVFSTKSATEFRFSPNNAWFAYKTKDNSHYTLSVVSTSDWNKKVLSTKLDGNAGTLWSLSSFTFNEAGNLLAVADGGKIKVWDIPAGLISRQLTLQHSVDLSNLIFVPKKNRISYTTDRSLFHWDLDNDHVTGSALATDFWGNLAYSRDGKILALGGAENRVRLFDVDHDTEVGSLVAPSDRDWLMITPDGRLDTSRLEEVEEAYWIVKQEPKKAQPLELFTRDFYTPRLLPRLFENETFLPLPDLSERNRALPTVEISGISADGPGKVKVKVLVQSSISQDQKNQAGQPLTSGAEGLRLFREGQLVAYSSPYNERIQLDAEGRSTFTFSVSLPHYLAAKKLDFAAYAFNSEHVKGITAHKSYEVPPSSEGTAKGRAYIISVGVNTTDVKAINLQFAANDAVAVADSLTSRLEAMHTFDKVVAVPLVSDTIQGKNQATKQQIQAVLQLLAGHRDRVSAALLAGIPGAARIEQAGPDDLVLFFFAGHGFSDESGEFYLMPSDLGRDAGPDLAVYKERAISNDDLSVWLRDIDARNLIMVIDACQSAAAVSDGSFKPGPLGSKGLGQLAYDKGMQVLAAAQGSESTYEFNSLKHGLLTYALIQDGLGAGMADFHPIDKKIFLGEWLRFGVERVPQLIADRQAPGGATPGPSQAGQTLRQRLEILQQPVLFDFIWNREDQLLSTQPWSPARTGAETSVTKDEERHKHRN